MKIIVEVPDYEANQVAKEISAVSAPIFNAGAAEDGRQDMRRKTVAPREAAKLFAQDLIDRYFSTEYLGCRKTIGQLIFWAEVVQRYLIEPMVGDTPETKMPIHGLIGPTAARRQLEARFRFARPTSPCPSIKTRSGSRRTKSGCIKREGNLMRREFADAIDLIIEKGPYVCRICGTGYKKFIPKCKVCERANIINPIKDNARGKKENGRKNGQC
ncbi:MAG: hypothetical protein WC976_06065 [Caldisericia bacterium]